MSEINPKFRLLVIGSMMNAAVMGKNFEMDRLKEKKVGYYIGSFDPIHLGHQHVIDTALSEKYIDYVLIYPAPGRDIFKSRTDLSFRQKMIVSIYGENSKILLTCWTPKELQDKFSEIGGEIEVIGIIGSDLITEKLMGPDKDLAEKYRKVFMRGIPLGEKHYEDTIGALMALKASSFIVALRGDIDLSYLEGTIYDRPIRAFIASSEISSTAVRNAIAKREDLGTLVSFPVEAIIKEEGLYTSK